MASGPRTPASQAPELELPRRISWSQHRAWLDHNWKAGIHVSTIAVTGDGKSYLMRHGLLPLWEDYRVLIIDSKGGRDETWQGYGQVVHAFPEAELRRRPGAEPGPRIYRLVVPGYEWRPEMKRDSDGVRRARAVVGQALSLVYQQGHWVLVIDETRSVTDSPEQFGLGLRGLVVNDWRMGRALDLTVLAGTQAPRYQPSEFYDQVGWLYIGPTLDGRSLDRLDEIGGDTQAIQAALPHLGEHEFLWVRRRTREMAIVRVGS